MDMSKKSVIVLIHNRHEPLDFKVTNELKSNRGSTPILCENRRPEVGRKLKWPYLKCCDSGDLCNSAVMSTPPSWVGSEKGGGTNDTQQHRKSTFLINHLLPGSSNVAVVLY
jgi:hypothetical protein